MPEKTPPSFQLQPLTAPGSRNRYEATSHYHKLYGHTANSLGGDGRGAFRTAQNNSNFTTQIHSRHCFGLASNSAIKREVRGSLSRCKAAVQATRNMSKKIFLDILNFDSLFIPDSPGNLGGCREAVCMSGAHVFFLMGSHRAAQLCGCRSVSFYRCMA